MPLSSRSFNKFAPSVERRRLAALMFTDIVSYSAAFHRDEDIAMKLLEKKSYLLRNLFPLYGGKEIKNLGDGFLIEFPSVQEAVKCAYDIQSHLFQMNLGAQQEERFNIRIGIHLCDFIATEDDAFGDDVNISSRLEKLAEPGGICVSQQVVDQVRDKLDMKFRLHKQKHLKNIKRPVVCYSIDLPWMDKKPVDEVVAGFSHRLKAFMNPMDLAIGLWQFFFVAMMLGLAYSFLSPGKDTHLEDYSQGLLVGASALMILNPLLAVASVVSWFGSFTERRLVYLSTSFVMASLALPTVIPHFFGMDAHTLSILPILSTGLIPLCFVLMSSFENKRPKVEAATGLVFVAFLGVLYTNPDGITLFGLKKAVLVAGTIALIYQLSEVRRLMKTGGSSSVTELRRSLYTVLCVLTYAAAVWDSNTSTETIFEMGTDRLFAVLYPVSTIIMIIYQQFVDARSLKVESSNWATLAQVNSIISGPEGFDDKVSDLQERVCKNLMAERSTVYLTDVDSAEPRLKAQSIYGPTEKLKEVALVISPEQGLIGRVWRTRNPMIVNDISTDDRISDDERPRDNTKNYRTDSCLLCPLIIGNETLGVMTFSDKMDGSVFTERELRLVQIVAKDVALLALNNRFQGMIDHFIAEKLGDLSKVG